MNSSIFLASFGFTHLVTSKSFTMPPMRVVNGVGSKWVMGPMPERLLTMPSHVVARSLPSGDTAPMPVITTRLFDMKHSERCAGRTGRIAIQTPRHGARGSKTRGRRTRPRSGFHGSPATMVSEANHRSRCCRLRDTSGLDVRLDVVDGLLHRGDLLGFFVRDLALELFLERHHQLDGVEGVSAEVIDERRVVGDFFFLHAELFDDDLLDAFFDAAHWVSLLPDREIRWISLNESRAFAKPPKALLLQPVTVTQATDMGEFSRHVHAAVHVKGLAGDVSGRGTRE